MRMSDWSSVVCSSDLAGGLGHRFHDQHAGHDRPAGEMPLEETLVDRNRLDRVDRAVRHERNHAVDEQHRITVRQRRHHPRSEEHTSELQSLMRISYAVFCLKKKNKTNYRIQHHQLILTHEHHHISMK